MTVFVFGSNLAGRHGAGVGCGRGRRETNLLQIRCTRNDRTLLQFVDIRVRNRVVFSDRGRKRREMSSTQLLGQRL
jgi:hypothetical protein